MKQNVLIVRLSLFVLILQSACSYESDPLVAFNAGDYKNSFSLWESMAESGDSTAQNYLGIHYYLGLGVKQDIKQSFYWYEKSAKLGNPDAQRNLGMLYESGKLGNRDFENSYIWMYASYKQGNLNASKTLRAISGQLSPERVQILIIHAMQYVINDNVDPENDDF